MFAVTLPNIYELELIKMANNNIYIIAEIGINHNGDMEICRQLIEGAAQAGANAVKFQKRTIDQVYTQEELNAPRESVFGTTNGDLKRGLEFSREQYDQIDQICDDLGIEWFASPWDVESVQFLAKFHIPYLKIASAVATNKQVLKACCQTGIPLIVSTGMCDLPLIGDIVDYIKVQGGEIACLMHCTSTYPSQPEELNLLGIQELQNCFLDIPVGYSGHEAGVPPTVMAAVLGATMIERHITLSRTMWGSDQAASLDVQGFTRMVRDVRLWERCKGDGRIVVYDTERPIEGKLRKVNDFR